MYISSKIVKIISVCNITLTQYNPSYGDFKLQKFVKILIFCLENLALRESIFMTFWTLLALILDDVKH